MRSKPSILWPLYRSPAQARILTLLLVGEDREVSIADLARAADLPLSTAVDEVNRLVRAEILTARKVGRTRVVRPNQSNHLLEPLTEIVTATAGPAAVISEAFAGAQDVDQLVIFGSWAAREAGVSGPPPNDIDVLVVGRPDRSDIYARADVAERRLGIPVHPVIASETRWNDPADPLMSQIRSSPMVVVDAVKEVPA